MSANAYPRWERGALVWACCVSAIGPACAHEPVFLEGDALTAWLTGHGPGSLSQRMEFDHVLRIDANGVVSDNVSGVYAPECFEPDPDATQLDGGWELITGGLTGQHGYAGPWLHDSELIEGGVAERILEHAAEHDGGYYVAVYATYPCSTCGPDDGCEDDIEGWAIAYKPMTQIEVAR